MVSRQLAWPSSMEKDTSKWPLLVAEGTGIYEPLGYAENTDPKAYVYTASSLAAFKKPIGHEERQSTPFFVASLIGTTGYFVRASQWKSGFGTFFYSNGAPGHRGALYDDIIADNRQNYGFVPLPKVPPVILNAIKESVAVAIPPKPLTLVKYARGQRDPAATNALLDKIVVAIDALNRPLPRSGLHVTTPIYIRPYQLNRQIADAILTDFKRRKRIYRVTYHLERITDTVYGYRVEVHVNTDADSRLDR